MQHKRTNVTVAQHFTFAKAIVARLRVYSLQVREYDETYLEHNTRDYDSEVNSTRRLLFTSFPFNYRTIWFMKRRNPSQSSRTHYSWFSSRARRMERVDVIEKENAVEMLHTIEHIDPLYVSFIRHSRARLKCRERFTVKQVLRLIAAMILLLCINSVIVVTKSICHDTWGVVKLFNVYYKNSVLTCSLPLVVVHLAPRSSLLRRAVWLRRLIKATRISSRFADRFECVLLALRGCNAEIDCKQNVSDALS